MVAEDETWELESSTEGDSASESDSDDEGGGRGAARSFRVAAVIEPRGRGVVDAAVGPSSSPQAAMKQAAAAPPARPTPRVSVGSLLQQPEAARTMAKQVMGNAQAGGLMTLVSHLRADNARLREALVAAQREAEALVEEQRCRGAVEERPGVDFGHLLELVRDFGADGLGGSEEDYALGGPATDAAQIFSMDSPRGEQREQPSTEAPEVVQLREELEESRAEVVRLRAELAAARSGTVH
mmetsp:Transcript_101253/g.291628  ORF Transcript_101253/g.291628 Transcript_101253/m.291628 type:complete len:240 (-) Transcript_101253:172-891(-)